MKSKLGLVLALIVLAGSIMVVNATISECVVLCYDSIKNSATKGYDPEFLKQPIVSEMCQQAHIDRLAAGMPDLGYCDKTLGTL